MEPDAAAGRTPCWKGARGEWYVVVQVALMGLLFFGPRTTAALAAWPFPFPRAGTLLGCLLMAFGGALFAAGLLRLGRALTPLPYPKEGAGLMQTGPYRLVRHPMYGGGLLFALGWALHLQGWLTLGYAAALFALLEAKSRREERWLEKKFPEYAAYRRRVRKFIPFIY